MGKILFEVEKHMCAECSLALRRFIGNMDGVQSIDVENGMIAIVFDDSRISRDTISRIMKDSMEKLGYRILS